MSSFVPIIDTSALQPASTAVKKLAQVNLDMNTLSAQPVMTTSSPETIITTIVFEKISGAALTLAVMKSGFNGAANDVIATQAMASLGSNGATLQVMPAAAARASPGQTLNAQMTVVAGGACTVMMTVFGVGG